MFANYAYYSIEHTHTFIIWMTQKVYMTSILKSIPGYGFLRVSTVVSDWPHSSWKVRDPASTGAACAPPAHRGVRTERAGSGKNCACGGRGKGQGKAWQDNPVTPTWREGKTTSRFLSEYMDFNSYEKQDSWLAFKQEFSRDLSLHELHGKFAFVCSQPLTYLGSLTLQGG